MTDAEQKRVFANNLTHYININGKQQNEVAKAIGEKPTTLNMWCKGNSFPSTGKIQKLADYFGIGKTDLTEDKTGKQRRVTYKNGQTVTVTRYVCQGKMDTVNPCIKHLEISARKIEEAMLNRLEIEIGHLQRDIRLSYGEIKEKIKQRRKLENKLDRLKELYVEGDISKNAYNAKKFQLEREISDIVIEQKQVPELPDGWKDTYNSLTPENKQVFWKRIIKSIIITSETKETPEIIFRT